MRREGAGMGAVRPKGFEAGSAGGGVTSAIQGARGMSSGQAAPVWARRAESSDKGRCPHPDFRIPPLDE